jgi:hypothetical protein
MILLLIVSELRSRDWLSFSEGYSLDRITNAILKISFDRERSLYLNQVCATDSTATRFKPAI